MIENPEGTIKNAGWFNIWAINAGGQSTGLHQLAFLIVPSGFSITSVWWRGTPEISSCAFTLANNRQASGISTRVRKVRIGKILGLNWLCGGARERAQDASIVRRRHALSMQSSTGRRRGGVRTSRVQPVRPTPGWTEDGRGNNAIPSEVPRYSAREHRNLEGPGNALSPVYWAK